MRELSLIHPVPTFLGPHLLRETDDNRERGILSVIGNELEVSLRAVAGCGIHVK